MESTRWEKAMPGSSAAVEKFNALAEKVKFVRNAYRVDVHPNQEVRIDKNGCKWLRRGPMSVTVRDGPLLAKAQVAPGV